MLARAVLVSLALAFWAVSARAQIAPYGIDLYLGGFAGYGASRPHSVNDPELESRVYPYATADSKAAFFGGYLGGGWGPIALEGGGLTLPTYHAFAIGADPPRSTHQTITGWAYYARGVVRIPPSWDWYVEPYAFFGAAHVYGANHEVGVCPTCGKGYVPDWRNWTSKWTPYYGLGAEIPVWGPVSTRLEVGFLPHAVNSFWTGDRTYTLGSVSLQMRF